MVSIINEILLNDMRIEEFLAMTINIEETFREDFSAELDRLVPDPGRRRPSGEPEQDRRGL